MTQAEFLSLLRDCLSLWGIEARVDAEGNNMHVHVAEGVFVITPAPLDERPARWQLQTPARAAAGREPRRHPSIAALLSALRNEFGAQVGNRLRITAAP